MEVTEVDKSSLFPDDLAVGLLKPRRKWKERLWKKRYLAIVFAVAIFVGVNLVVQALEPAMYDSLRYRDRMFTEKRVLLQSQPRADVLILGSSVAATGLNPLVIEQEFFNNTGYKIRSLNLGISGSNADLQYLILKNLITEDKKPSVIIYALTDLELEFKDLPGVYRSFDKIAYGQNLTRLDDFGDYSGDTLETKADFLLRQFFPLYRDRRLIQDSLSIQFNPNDPDHYKYTDRVVPDLSVDTGFHGLPDYTQADSTWLQIDLERQKSLYRFYNLDNVDLTNLERFLTLARERNIKVILVNAPATPEHRALWSQPSQVEKYQSLIKDLSDRFKVPLLDLYTNDKNFFQPQNFSDSIHLSDSGATIESILVTRDYLVKEFPKQEAPPNPLPVNFYKAGLSPMNISPRLPTQYTLQQKVQVTNLSPYLWPLTGPGQVVLSYRWFDLNNRQVGPDGVYTPLQYAGGSGGSEEALLKVHTPDSPGNYVLSIDLRREGGEWFSDFGNKPLLVPVTIYTRNDAVN